MSEQIRERPILFNSEMVRAILDGEKTVTRRLIKPQPTTKMMDFDDAAELIAAACEPYQVGDRVRVRQWEDMKTIPAFACGMRPLCGKTAVIECVSGNGVVHVIPCDSANDPLWGCFTFTPDMFEPAEEVKPMSGLERALGVQEGRLND